MNTSNIVLVDIAQIHIADANELCPSLMYHDGRKLWSMSKDDCEKFMEFTERKYISDTEDI